MSFWNELKRRDVFKVAVAYLVASWLIIQIVDVLAQPLRLPDVFETISVVVLVIGFPVALIIAWIYEVTPEGVKVTPEAGADARAGRPSSQRLTYVVMGLLVTAVGLMAVDTYVLRPTLPDNDFGEVRRMAILPCTDLSPDPTNSFFADGIHTELIQRLGSLHGLDVISQTSVQRFSDGRTPVPQVALELEADAVMECFARYAGDQVLLMTQLIDGISDADLWSASYRADMSDLSSLFDIQADIATNVASALAVELSLEEQQAIDRSPTDSPEAYALYLRAVSVRSIDNAQMRDLLERALAFDPEYAEAHALKGWFHAAALVNTTGLNAISVEEREREIALARFHMARAVAINPSLAWVQGTLAVTQTWRWSEALAQLEEAVDPVDSFAVWLHSYVGEHEKAIARARRRVELDPGTWNSWWILGAALAYGNETNEAAEVFRKAIAIYPSAPPLRLWRAYIEMQQGNFESAAMELASVERLLAQDRQAVYLPELAYAYARVGRQADADRITDEIEQAGTNIEIGTGGRAMVDLARGDYQAAIEQLVNAIGKIENHEIDEGFWNLMNVRMNVMADPLLEEPRFAEVRARLRGD